MSDGEKLYFILLKKVVCTQNSIVIIDEPENHLHLVNNQKDYGIR